MDTHKSIKFILLLCIFFAFSKLSFSQDEFEMKFGDSTVIMKKYVFGLYKRGLNKDIDSVQLTKLQAAHLEHLTELSKSGKLCIAGPFDGDNEIRGILIFNVNDIKEAEKYLMEDPAVKAGRLTFELYYWWAAKGSFLK
jgi:uncharacterized protein